MRFLSKLEHWFRANRGQDKDDFRQGDLFSQVDMVGGFLDERMPHTTPRVFQAIINQAIRETNGSETARLWTLDRCLHLLVVCNPAENQKEERALTIEIDRALKPLRHQQDQLLSITWTAIKQSRPPFAESYKNWAEQPEAFEGDIGLVFFVDSEAFTMCISHQCHRLGLASKLDEDGVTIHVSDGDYVSNINTNAVLMEGIWTGRGLLSVAKSRASQVPSELRAFKSLFLGLKRRFPFLHFELGPQSIAMQTKEGIYWLDYGHIVAAMKNSSCGIDNWLQRIVWRDLVHFAQQPTVLVRSPEYVSAWPEALHRAQEDHVLVAMYEEDGRLRPVFVTDEDPPSRFDHYFDEAKRQLGFQAFKAHVFIDEDDEDGYGVAFVGDHVATATIDPRLISGLLEGFGPYPEIVSVEVLSEDVMLVCSTDYAQAARARLLEQAQTLSKELDGYGADPLVMKRTMKLDRQCLGHADLTMVSQSFFFLLDKAKKTDVAMLPGRADFFMGVAKEMIEKNDDAINSFQRAVAHDRSNGDFNFALGRILSRHRRHHEAVDYLDVAFGAFPKRPEVANTYGLALEKSGNTPKALEIFRHAASVTPNDADILANLGRTLVQMSLLDEASGILSRALSIDTENSGAHAAMADLYLRQGHRKEALMHLREALSEDPKNEGARKMFEALWKGSLGQLEEPE